MVKKVMLDEHTEILARLDERMQNIQKEVSELKELLQKEFVHISEFTPVKMIVYGLVSLVMTGVIGSILYLVLK